jgi:hypothetical protein
MAWGMALFPETDYWSLVDYASKDFRASQPLGKHNYLFANANQRGVSHTPRHVIRKPSELSQIAPTTECPAQGHRAGRRDEFHNAAPTGPPEFAPVPPGIVALVVSNATADNAQD